MSSASQPVFYRPEIDGLRAIAVLAVVFYHAGLGCPGGYVGVDIFFVISGYLITALILKDLRLGTFSLGEFWDRRVRRIFPALAVCILVTLVAGFFLLLPDDLAALGKSSIAQSLLVANFFFWRTTNYFDGASEDKPLLHTWSLAVEEQFYVVFPLLLLLLFRQPCFRRTSRLIALLLAGGTISLAVSAWGVTHQPFATFFLLPTRAWELLCGAIIAALPVATAPQSRWLREGSSWLGLGAILLAIFKYNAATPFPGLAALPPCLGTALLIWGNGRISANYTAHPTLAARFLSMRAVVFIGLISYSLYLWHWPVIVFANYWKIREFPPAASWVLVAISVMLATASWRWIEVPFRTRRLCSSRTAIYRFSGIFASGLLLISLGLSITGGIPSRLSLVASSMIELLNQDEADRRKFTKAGNIEDVGTINFDQIESIGAVGLEQKPAFLLLGDSHAQFAAQTFDKLAAKHGVSGVVITYQGTPPLTGWNHRYRLAAKQPQRLFDASLDYARRHKIRYVFLAAYWSSYQKQTSEEELELHLIKTIEKFREIDAQLIILHDNPTYESNVARALLRSSFFRWDLAKIPSQTKEQYEQTQSGVFAASRKALDVCFLDPTSQLLKSDGISFILESGGKPLYMDGNHFTGFGADITWTPILSPIFMSISREIDARKRLQSFDK